MARKPRPVKKPTRPLCLVVCEGATEANYFKEIARDVRHVYALVSIDAQSGNKVCDIAAKKVTKANDQDNPFDHVIVVFDHDNDPKFFTANTAKCQNEKWLAVRSSLCFEVWFLAHVSKSAKCFKHPRDAEKCLRNYPDFNDFKKGKSGYWGKLKPKLDSAIETCREWNKSGASHPYSDVGEFIGALLKGSL